MNCSLSISGQQLHSRTFLFYLVIDIKNLWWISRGIELFDLINTIYKKVNGEEIAETATANPLFKNDVSYMDKVYRNMIKEMNKEIRER